MNDQELVNEINRRIASEKSKGFSVYTEEVIMTDELYRLLALAQSYLDYMDSLAAVDTSDQDVV